MSAGPGHRLIQVLEGLRRFLGGEKAILLWDGLPSHRSTAMRAWLNPQRSWLVVERVRRTPHLAYSFLRHAGLSVS
jgi:hypothetical protein